MSVCTAFCSWSGGKDSALAFHRATKAGVQIRYLLTMMTEDGKRSRSNGVPRRMLQLQADSLGIPIMMRSTSWQLYERTFLTALGELRSHGVSIGVFGDIDIADHRAWVERVCHEAGISALLPLWRRARIEVIEELLQLRFSAVIVAVRDGTLEKGMLGRSIDRSILEALQEAGADLCGENGEYHTVVTRSPDFAFPISIDRVRPMLHSGYWVALP